MFDTHCHLNFKAFRKELLNIIQSAKQKGVHNIVIPGTDVPTSREAIVIVNGHEGIFAAVGIHPHHVYKYLTIEANSKLTSEQMIEQDLKDIEALLSHKKVVAIGEVGMDRHIYEHTKYEKYSIDSRFIELQKLILHRQIQLALLHNKSLILHNREAKDILLALLEESWDQRLEGRTVFHCCEPDEDLLIFAKAHKIYIGIDGDITYIPEKQQFIKNVPLDMLVLETDSPYLLPEPLRSKKLYPNKPEHLSVVSEYIAGLFGIKKEDLIKTTTINANNLFKISTK